MQFSQIDTLLKGRIALDVILGAVSTWDLATSHIDLYFNRSDLRKLYADTSYPYRNEEQFIAAAHARFAGSRILNGSNDRIIMSLGPENMNEIMTQAMAIRAVADTRSAVPTR